MTITKMRNHLGKKEGVCKIIISTFLAQISSRAVLIQTKLLPTLCSKQMTILQLYFTRVFLFNAILPRPILSFSPPHVFACLLILSQQALPHPTSSCSHLQGRRVYNLSQVIVSDMVGTCMVLRISISP